MAEVSGCAKSAGAKSAVNQELSSASTEGNPQISGGIRVLNRPDNLPRPARVIGEEQFQNQNWARHVRVREDLVSQYTRAEQVVQQLTIASEHYLLPLEFRLRIQRANPQQRLLNLLVQITGLDKKTLQNAMELESIDKNTRARVLQRDMTKIYALYSILEAELKTISYLEKEEKRLMRVMINDEFDYDD